MGEAASDREAAEKDYDVGRIASFSDAVFAVAITLLVLNIDVPMNAGKELGNELWKLWPQFGAFLLSFVIIGAFWIFHHTLLRKIERHDALFIWLNLALLLCIVFMPFVASLFSEYPNTEIATILYSGTWSVASMLFAIIWYYSTRKNRLVGEDFDPGKGFHAALAFMSTSIIFLVSIPIALVNVSAAQYFWIMLFPTHLALGIIQGRRERETDSLEQNAKSGT